MLTQNWTIMILLYLLRVVAQVCGSFIWVPMEVIRERQQVYATADKILEQNSQSHTMYGKSSSSPQLFRQLISSRTGLNSLYRGFTLSLLSWAPFNAIYFPLYEHCKRVAAPIFGYGMSGDWQEGRSQDKHLPWYAVNACALLSASIAAVVTNPLDVLKTNIQVSEKHSREYGTIIKSVSTILRDQGIQGFFRGAGARVIWLTPKHAMGFTFYEMVKPFVKSIIDEP